MEASRNRITLFPMPELGHTNAMIVIARKLRDRGHTIQWICPITPIRKHIEANGFEVISFGEDLDREAELVAGFLSQPPGFLFRTLLEKLREGNLQRYREYVMSVEASLAKLLCGSAVRDALVDARTELFLCDSAWNPPAMIAQSLGIPTVLLSTTLPTHRLPGVPPLDRSIVPDGTSLTRLKCAGYWEWHLARRWLNSSLARLGVRINEQAATRKAAAAWGLDIKSLNFDSVHQFGANLDMPKLILCSREFDYPGVPDRDLHYVGPCIDVTRKEIDFPWGRIDASKKLIYCSLGSVSPIVAARRSFFERVVEAVRHHDEWQLIMSVGSEIPTDSFAGLPASAIVVRQTPQLAMLKRCALMITAGGFNSLKECILLGTRFVQFPMATDQPGNAARVRYHGIGLTGDIEESTPHEIEHMISQVLRDEDMYGRLKRMQAIFQRDEAADLVMTTFARLMTASAAPRQRTAQV